MKGKVSITLDHDTWEDMGEPETPEALHKALLLPKNYVILEATIASDPPRFELLLEHPAIPAVEEGQELPTINFSYRQDMQEEKYVPVFVGGICGQWDGERWQVTPILEG